MVAVVRDVGPLQSCHLSKKDRSVLGLETNGSCTIHARWSLPHPGYLIICSKYKSQVMTAHQWRIGRDERWTTPVTMGVVETFIQGMVDAWETKEMAPRQCIHRAERTMIRLGSLALCRCAARK